MADDSVGSVSVDVVPDARGWAEKLRAQIRDTVVRPRIEPEVTPGTEERLAEKGRTSGDKFAGEFDRIIQTKLRAALASLPDVKLDADASPAQQRLAELRTEIETLSQAKVGVDVESATALAKIREVRAELGTLAASAPNVQVSVDALAAQARLAEVNAEVDKLNGRTAKVNVKTDRSTADRTKNFIESLSSHLRILPALAVAGTAAVIPLAGALGGVVAALAAPLAIAGAGVTLYSFLVGAAIKQTEKQKKQLDQLKKTVDSAEQSLANAQSSAAASAQNSLASASRSAQNSLAAARASAEASIKAARQAEASATTQAGRDAARRRIAAAQASLAAREQSVNASLASRQASVQASQTSRIAAAQQKVNEATAAYQKALKGLTPDQSKFLTAQEGLKSAFQHLIEKAGPALLGPATQFLNLLSRILPDATPILTAVSGALGAIFDEMERGGQSAGFRNFVQMFAHQLGPDLTSLAHILGNVVRGLGGLFLAIDRHAGGGGMLAALDHLTGTFADWGNSRAARHDVQEFFDYFHKVGPDVGRTLTAIAHAAGRIVEALAPLGPPVLRIVKGIADAISGIPVPVLTAMAAAFVALTAAAKIGNGVSKLSSSLGLGKVFPKIFGERGMSPANPLYVFSVNGGAGGLASDIEKGGFLAGLLKAAGYTGEGAFGAIAADAATLAVPAAISAYVLSHPDPIRKSNPKGVQVINQLATRPGYQMPMGTGITIPTTPSHPSLEAVATTADALRANLATASRQLDLIGPQTDHASQKVQALADQLHKLVTMKYGFSVDANTLEATKRLEALQAFRLRDKAFTARVELEVERAVGPGGGMGRPTGTSGGGSGGGAGRSGPTYTGDIRIEAHDYKDFQQQIQARHRRASIDGVRRG